MQISRILCSASLVRAHTPPRAYHVCPLIRSIRVAVGLQSRKQAFDMALADWGLDTGSTGSGLRGAAHAPGIGLGPARPTTPLSPHGVTTGLTPLARVARDYTPSASERWTGQAMFTSGSGATLGNSVPVAEDEVWQNDLKGQSTGPGGSARLLYDHATPSMISMMRVVTVWLLWCAGTWGSSCLCSTWLKPGSRSRTRISSPPSSRGC